MIILRTKPSFLKFESITQTFLEWKQTCVHSHKHFGHPVTWGKSYTPSQYQNLALKSSLHETNAAPEGEWVIQRMWLLWPGGRKEARTLKHLEIKQKTKKKKAPNSCSSTLQHFLLLIRVISSPRVLKRVLREIWYEIAFGLFRKLSGILIL